MAPKFGVQRQAHTSSIAWTNPPLIPTSTEYLMTTLILLTSFACSNGKISTGEGFQNDATAAGEPSTPSEGEAAPAETPESTDENPDGDSSQEGDELDEGADLDEGSADSETDTGASEAEVEEDVEGSTGETTLTVEDYVTTYCSTFAVPCVGYPSVEACVDFMIEAHFEGCDVVDPSALHECNEWVSTITCDETSWLAACDDFIECD